MKKYFFSVILLFVLISTSLAQWQRVQTLPSWTYFGGCVDALGDDFAVIVKSAKQIQITTDAGKTWTTKNIPSTEELTVDISAVTNNIFYIATSSNGGRSGNFYKTTDGGNSWFSVSSNPSLTSCGNYIRMFSETKGIAMGDGPFVSVSPYVLSNKALFLKTTNGGDWQQNNSAEVGFSGDSWRRIDFVDENNGYFYRSGISPELLLKTTDGGTTWTNTNFRENGRGWMVKFYDKDYGFVFDYDYVNRINLVDRTTDGGADWQIINVTGMGRINDIEFVHSKPAYVWLGASTILYFSADSGRTWTQKIVSDKAERFDDIVFPTKKTGWVITTTGLYYTNNNGGVATDISQENNLPTSFKLFQNYPNPFNPETTIRFQLSDPAFVTLKVYDALGKEVAVLVNEFKQAGVQSSVFNINNYSLPSGIYFYRLTAGNYSSTQKMVLLK